MYKRSMGIIFAILLLLGLFPISTLAKPTNAQIDFQARGVSGSIAPCGGKIYLVSSGILYSASGNGKSLTRVATLGIQGEREYNDYVFNLQSHGGYLYYEFNEGGSHATTLYRYKPGGKPEAFQTNISSYTIGGDTLYYDTPSGKYIKSIHLKTGEKKTEITEISNFKLHISNFLEDVLEIYAEDTTYDAYYRTDSHYRLYNPANKKVVRLDKKIVPLQTRGSYFYYYTRNSSEEADTLYRALLNSKTLKISDPKPIYTFNPNLMDVFISGDSLYFQYELYSEGSVWALYRQNIATGASKRMYIEEYYEHSWFYPYGEYLWLFGQDEGFGPYHLVTIGK